MGGRPVRQVIAHSLFNRVVWPVFALVWLIMTFGPAVDMVNSGEDWGLLMPGVFLLIGLFILLLGLRAAFWSRTVTLDADRVRVAERGTAGTSSWEQPLETYRGVALLDVAVQRKGRAFSLPAIVLDHDDPARRIVLWSSLASRRRDAVCRDYAAWLDLPVVEALVHQESGGSGNQAAVTRAPAA